MCLSVLILLTPVAGHRSADLTIVARHGSADLAKNLLASPEGWCAIAVL